ncbi:glycosyl transferase family 2, partial [Enterococcus faecium]|uniref:glycosyltransferase family 2 protein n=1 Tax=Enterococcus faecium TaxID=1352 RepID=UPI0013FD120C
ILGQTFTDFELLLIDDGSTDNSGSICDELAKTDNRIKVIHKENGGLSDARNIGIEVAKGDFIGFIDSDDYIDEDMYEILYENLKIHDADISSVELIPFYGDRYK